MKVLSLIKEAEFEKYKPEIEKQITGTNKLSLTNIKNKQNEIHHLFEKQKQDKEETKQKFLLQLFEGWKPISKISRQKLLN